MSSKPASRGPVSSKPASSVLETCLRSEPKRDCADLYALCLQKRPFTVFSQYLVPLLHLLTSTTRSSFACVSGGFRA